eukprot:jgi/Tetstr1/450308/TSEL_037344.t1
MNDRSQGGIGDSSDDEGPGGLTSAEARERLVQFGPNRLRQASARSTFSIFLAQFRSVVVLVLVAAGVFSAWAGDLIEAAAIAGVLIINTAIGFASELRGVQAMQSLRKLTVPTATAQPESSPLLTRLNKLGGQLVWITAGIVSLLFVLGVMAGHDPQEVAKTAIALGVAAIPEGLPVVATLVLARGMWRMAQQNAVVRTLSAVETLGATTLILTDKTGTLTENVMTLTELWTASGRYTDDQLFNGSGCLQQGTVELALRLGVLCTEIVSKEHTKSDPMEIALIEGARHAGLDPETLRNAYPLDHQIAFDPANAMMASIHQDAAGYLVAVKGAPEAVLAASSYVAFADGIQPLDEDKRTDWLKRNAEMAASGLRVLALAYRVSRDADVSAFCQLVMVGLVGLSDPARPDVSAALASCRAAGVRIVMVTGDHKQTACAIGRDVGLVTDGDLALDQSEIGELTEPANAEALEQVVVFSRVRPETKLELVEFFPAQG